tara:strand:- start:3155 stop:3586 length:432 start_codon:yes stop_codon:yes gene_type:complete
VAITFVNNWKNILDKLRSVLRTEFKKSIPVYIGNEDVRASTQYIRLEPVSNTLVDYNSSKNLKEYTVIIEYVFSGANVKKTVLDNILRVIERTQHLINDNTTMTLADSTNAFDCKLEESELNTDESEGLYVSTWNWTCLHMDV